MTEVAGRAPAFTRYRAFVTAVFAPHIHLTYGILWALAYEAAAASTQNGLWRPSPASAVRAATVILMLLYLRLVDERKDEAYDRVHNPDRPLISGLVTATELRRAGWVVAAAILVGNAMLDRWSPLVLAGFVGYTNALTLLESRFPVLRNRPLINIVVVYPVQLLIGIYLYVSSVGTAVIRPGIRPVLMVLMFAAAFLHYEFARKTVRKAAAGSRAYSATALGAIGSGVLTLGWAVAACAILAAVTEPWHAPVLLLLPYAALVFPVLGAFAYLRGRTDVWPRPQALLFLIVLYASIVVTGLFAT